MVYDIFMDNIALRRGETLELTITADDLTADTILFTAANDDGIVISETANFSTVDGDRVATIKTDDTLIDVGEYSYMLTITYSDGVVDKLPDADSCEDDGCDLPTLTICEAIDLEVS